jgi:lipopolysaccharide/colanic/teichoic acid biosynthesis glycosyltransferase
VLKRAFDVTVASIGLVCLAPFLCVVAVLIKFDSNGPVFFRQERVGTRFRLFQIYKFRTMVSEAARTGGSITCGEDPRITRVGHHLRRTKIDEVPQLINVLKGDMSIVGPRPELPEYVERFKDDYREILMVRPGMTDLASIKFRDEAALLGSSPDPVALYIGHVLPEKLHLGKQYVREASLLSDVKLIVRTLAALSGFKVS